MIFDIILSVCAVITTIFVIIIVSKLEKIRILLSMK